MCAHSTRSNRRALAPGTLCSNAPPCAVQYTLRSQFEKHGKDEHGRRIHTVVDAVSKDPPEPDMRMVLVDGKWRLMTNTVQAGAE